MAETVKGKNKHWFDRKNIITIISLSISFSFTVFFFSPTDVFLGNQQEFIINAYHIIIPMLLLAAAASLILMLIGFLTLKNKTVYNAFTSLMFGLLLAFYVQMLVFNGDMGLLIDSRNSYTEPSFRNTVNFAVMYIIVFIPLIMTFKREKSGSEGGMTGFAKGKAISYLSVLIFAMQLAGDRKSVV